MSDLRTAAQQAIALICSARLCEVNSMSSRQEMLRLMIESTDVLRAALAEPVQSAATNIGCLGMPVNTPVTPPQRKPLTEEEIRQIALDTPIGGTNFARAIERAHGIKENS